METKKYGIPSLRRDFPSDDKCLEFIFNTLHSKECSCGGTYKRINGRQQYQCSKCRFQIAPTANTIFEKSTTPLTLWFHAILLFSNAKSGLSAKYLQRELEVTYKTAWRMLKLIREALKQDNNKLRDVVEVDAEVIGGVSTVEKRMANKTKIMVAIQRNGEIRAKVVPDHSSETHRKFIEENIEKGSILLTDNALHYKNSAKGFDRLHVNHSKGEYARNGVHINSVETFFAHLKRSLKGVHKTISPEHLQSYLDGFVFQRNNAYSDK